MILDTIIIQPGIDSIMALREREREGGREGGREPTSFDSDLAFVWSKAFIIRQAVKLWLVKVACLYCKSIFEIIYFFILNYCFSIFRLFSLVNIKNKILKNKKYYFNIFLYKKYFE